MQDAAIVEVLSYKTKKGDTFDTIALELYAEGRMASVLMEHNKEHISTLIFDAGVSLNLPVFSGSALPVSLPPWRR